MNESSRTESACGICANTVDNRVVLAEERMYGMGDTFRYLHCGACGVLHLMDIPADLGRYYTADGYYSVNSAQGRLRRWLMRRRDQGCAGRSVVGSLLERRFPNPTLVSALAVAQPDSRILDVGCGGGALLKSMAALGFRHLTGVDPLLAQSSGADGVRLISGELPCVEGQFDVVMFHHSLEHMASQVPMLAAARERLAPGGVVLVRIPTCESLAFETYGARWFQLDAPRHLFLHSHRSIRRIAEQAGLAVASIVCDSQTMQFWASEMYVDDVPLMSPRMPEYRDRDPKFQRRLAQWANDHGRGDQIVVRMAAQASG